MTIDEKYMRRCLQLAVNGRARAKPNPMVGAVIVHGDKIIGEGYHRKYSEAHAEVNAIRSVNDESLLPESVMYVSLEPCAHYGKTPPCASLIISKKIPRVVVACFDPNPAVSGKGIRMMQEAGVDVSVGLLQSEAEELNRFFFVNQLYKRPYIVLKWAQSNDGYMDFHRASLSESYPIRISNDLTMSIVHKFRAEMQGIMVGTNTVLLDNPKLTVRKWSGENPVRITIDRVGKIAPDASIFDGEAKTLVFTQMPDYPIKKMDVKAIRIDFEKEINRQIVNRLYDEKIYSVMIEGGAYLLSSFIDAGLWDEAFVEISQKPLYSGVKAPLIPSGELSTKKYFGATQIHLKNKISRKFL